MTISSLLDKQLREQDENARVNKFGPAPINPFTALRSAKGWTISDLARFSNIDAMALKRSEFGTYSNPLPALVDFWVKRHNQSHSIIHEDYDDFINAQRARHRYYFGADLNYDPLDSDHPFRQLRSNRPSLANGNPLPVGVLETSKALCIPLDTIQFFEKKYATQQSVPKPIKAALTQIGYEPDEVRKLEINYQEWRDVKLDKVMSFR